MRLASNVLASHGKECYIMEKYNKECVGAIYSDREFIIIGLTGRTGSGCSTASKILEKNRFEEIYKTDVNQLFGNEKRKNLIIYNYTVKNWQAFTVIKVSNVIALMVAEKLSVESPESHYQLIKNLTASTSLKPEEISKALKTKSQTHPTYETAEALNEELLSELGQSTYKQLFQLFGDNIRRSGNPLNSSDVDGGACFSLARRIWDVIQNKKEALQKSSKKPFFVIDAIRNPYDAQYFKQRFSAFYMVAITVDHTTRRKRLTELNYTKTDIHHLDYKEGIEAEELGASADELEKIKNTTPDPKKMLFGQNIGSCLEFADIFIDNPNDEIAKNGNPRKLADELIKFYALMRRPGLVTPTPIERSMQIAFTAKYNSGCLSRQVGAVVTNSSFSVLSIGWNDVPKGQVSCNLRNVEYFLRQRDEEAFSPFERTTKNFFEHIQKKFEGKSSKLREAGKIPVYCFKSEYNDLKKTNNQVFVRALHAEENAFLQIALRGGVGIEGGFLFTTASPCELCAKKAYQLGIKKIYYVDPYPGISKELILLTGEHRPEMVLFSGAIGRAYDQLYRPLMPVKDEVKYLMDPS